MRSQSVFQRHHGERGARGETAAPPHVARLARALADRAGELPPDDALRELAVGDAAHARDAALLMLLERRALLRARAAVLSNASGPDPLPISS